MFNGPNWNVIGWESGSMVESAREGPEFTSSIKTKLKTTHYPLNRGTNPPSTGMSAWRVTGSIVIGGTWDRNPGLQPHLPAGVFETRVIPAPTSFKQTQQQSLACVWENRRGCLAQCWAHSQVSIHNVTLYKLGVIRGLPRQSCWAQPGLTCRGYYRLQHMGRCCFCFTRPEFLHANHFLNSSQRQLNYKNQ